MFRTLVALFLALAMAPVFTAVAWAQGSYRIQAGDVLQMEVLEDTSLNRSLLVLPDGTVSVPLAGTVSATGQTIEALRGAISAALAPNFAAPPTVFLTVSQLNPRTQAVTAASAQAAAQAAVSGTLAATVPISALGEVARPGRIDVAPGTTLLQFLAESGGMTRFAATKRIQLRRADKDTGLESVYRFNYKAVQAGAKAPVIVLQAGDVIVVPERRLFE